jgi:hypothetical protein
MYNAEESAIEQTIEQKANDYCARVEENRIPKPECCQVCGRAGCLRWRGSYARSLITMAGTYTLPIKRVFCHFCGHTFGLLPDFVLKFYHYAGETILCAVRMLKSHTFEAVAGKFIVERKNRCLAILTLYFWRRKFAG